MFNVPLNFSEFMYRLIIFGGFAGAFITIIIQCNRR